jgi:ribulose-bisphosphate carboxylase large chain
VRSNVEVTYRIRTDAASIEARAHTIAVEQSVEMPLGAIDDASILDHVLGEVLDIADRGDGTFDVRIGLATATTGHEAGQLLNMLFGNTSIHEDVVLQDMELPEAMAGAFGGPGHGITGLRTRVGVTERPLTCSALKPQGSSAARLAGLARQMALGGIDYIKDDHGLADQDYSPFADRVRAIAEAVGDASEATGHTTRYTPSLAGNLDDLRRQADIARQHGLDSVLIAPMVVGIPAFHTIVGECPDLAFIAHPALAGASRLAPPLHFGKLFRLLGADAVVYPNHGGRFGYSAATCRSIAEAARAPWLGLAPTLPVPAGGMSPARTAEMVDFYGSDVMLLIGGALLEAGDKLAEATAAFVTASKEAAERQRETAQRNGGEGAGI